ncbi:MAG: cystathionine gamma-lyase [Edaphobacter sp.]|uniref:cystathionine gamma-lyase n=1 Tax=Edaphobacter sp. TaxID=1934404 RepID=UPI0023A5387C|nr:cystathionine gamma-lyase [Edaphobacter sp.]MDE1177672.1 cystathionine gamma-lyase [Edaphobacter sp.]
MRDATRIIRSGLTRAVAGEPLHAGPVFAAPYHAPGDPTGVPYTYARAHNPTWTHLEETIAQMESAEGYTASALVFATGMAAITAVFGATLRPGDAVVLPSNSYYAARVLAKEYFAEMGVELRFANTANNAQAELLQGARLLFLETPSNPEMELADIAALADAAHRAGALVAVDNTTPTALGQKPLALGADISVASDTKSMTGHSDTLIGHVATRDPELHAKISRWRMLTGGVLGPMEAWLAHRSIATLPLRLERSCANAQAIAEYLSTRRDVEAVLYPGLPTHPGHEIAAKQMRYFGPVVSFILRDKLTAERFLSASKLLTDATSFGGITSSAERRARWGGDAISEGFIRLSAGCEDIDDLLEDIAQALDATR